MNVYILNPFIRNLCLNSYDKTDKRKYHLVGDKHFISSTTTKESITGHLVNSYKKALSCKRHVKEVQNFDLQLEEFDKFSDKSSNKTSAIKLRAKSMDDKRKKGRLMINEYDSTNHIENSFIKENTNLLNWPKFAKFHKSQTEKTFKTKKLSIVKANTSGKRKKQIK